MQTLTQSIHDYLISYYLKIYLVMPNTPVLMVNLNIQIVFESDNLQTNH